MTDEENDGDDLANDIAAAVESQRTAGIEPGPQIGTKEPETEEVEEPVKETRDGGRDEKGRFVQKDEAEGEAEEPEDRKQEPEEDLRQDLDRPPKRLSVKTKNNWMSLPAETRQDFLTLEAQAHNGGKDYAGLEEFAATARSNNTTLARAVKDYAAVEDALRTDPVGAIVSIWQRMGLNPREQYGKMLARFGSQQVQGEDQQQQPQQPQIDPNAIARMVYERTKSDFENEKIATQIKSFETDPKNVYFSDIRGDMAGLVNSPLINPETNQRYGLEDSYAAILRLRGVSPPLKNGDAAKAQQAVAATKARNAAKAVGGPPSHTNASARPRDSGNSRSIMDEIEAAVAAQRGAA